MMKKSLFLLSALLFSGSAFCSGPTYSQVVTAGDFAYVSAQLPIDPTTGKIVQGDITTLTNLVIDHIQHELHVKGFTLKQVIKTEVSLYDIRDYDQMDAAYGLRFNFTYPPARDVIQAANLPSNASIQISCIAYRLRA